MRKCIVLSFIAILLAAFLSAAALAGPMGETLFKSCANCHTADGSMSAKAGGTTLKGQTAEALEKKLLGYQDGTYGGVKAMIMKNMVKKLSNDDIKTLAGYIAGF